MCTYRTQSNFPRPTCHRFRVRKRAERSISTAWILAKEIKMKRPCTRLTKRMGLHSSVLAILFAMIVGLSTGPVVDAAPIEKRPAAAEASVVAEISGLVEIGAASLGERPYRYVRCNSSRGRRNTCNTFGRNPVTLWQQHSRSSCARRRDWNTMNSGRQIWVDNGCQATFRVRW